MLLKIFKWIFETEVYYFFIHFFKIKDSLTTNNILLYIALLCIERYIISLNSRVNEIPLISFKIMKNLEPQYKCLKCRQK